MQKKVVKQMNEIEASENTKEKKKENAEKAEYLKKT